MVIIFTMIFLVAHSDEATGVINKKDFFFIVYRFRIMITKSSDVK